MFPQFRKTSDSKNYYKILSENEFIQIQRIGSKLKKYQFKVDKYPEKLMIKDMLSTTSDFYLNIEKLEFETIETLIP
jgi:hypothetical protein